MFGFGNALEKFSIKKENNSETKENSLEAEKQAEILKFQQHKEDIKKQIEQYGGTEAFSQMLEKHKISVGDIVTSALEGPKETLNSIGKNFEVLAGANIVLFLGAATTDPQTFGMFAPVVGIVEAGLLGKSIITNSVHAVSNKIEKWKKMKELNKLKDEADTLGVVAKGRE